MKKIILDKEYIELLNEIKNKVKNSQLKAVVSTNKELLNLYWYIGKKIVEEQEKSKWGEAIIRELSNDLIKEFPEMKGFSKTNIFNIRKWYLFYKDSNEKIQQLVGQLPWGVIY